MIFSGKVQGVFFRANGKRKADELDVTGWIRNTPDGTVEMKAEGSREAIEELVGWCKSKQPFAEVVDVEIVWTKGEPEYNEFRILR
ncbi:MAG: acylphosphatase [Candidatus Thermoplasmatota archaeon]|nr:acylphosphatase [Candidatus Thermoplasmatota archaeon]